MKVIVFDLGGTLMKYVGMPHSWVEFYEKGFEAINQVYHCNGSEKDIDKSVRILSEMNPRVNYREEEYFPEEMFTKALEHWTVELPIKECVQVFWSSLELKAEIFPDTISSLRKLKEKGFVIATLTDLPSGFPDELFKRDIAELTEYFDYYVSSAIAGYRKPNFTGLRMIAEKYCVSLSELILVGDEEKDRLTAENAGCRFVRIDRTGVGKSDIGSLNDLLGLLL